MGPVLDYVNGSVPTRARLGIFVNGDDWDFPLFGVHLDRQIEPLILPAESSGSTTRVPKLQYVLTHQSDSRISLFFRTLVRMHCRMSWSYKAVHQPTPWKLYYCMSRLQA